MAFGVRDERRVTLTVGTQTGGCLWSALRHGPVQLKSKLFSSGSIWGISWGTGVQQLLVQLPAGVSFCLTSHSFPLSPIHIFSFEHWTWANSHWRWTQWLWQKLQVIVRSEALRGRNSSWFFFFLLCPSVLLLKRKNWYHLIALSASSERDLPLN